MKREEAIEALARTLAARDGHTLTMSDKGKAGQRAHAYVNLARTVVTHVEQSMKDFSWHPEPSAVER